MAAGQPRPSAHDQHQATAGVRIERYCSPANPGQGPWPRRQVSSSLTAVSAIDSCSTWVVACTLGPLRFPASSGGHLSRRLWEGHQRSGRSGQLRPLPARTTAQPPASFRSRRTNPLHSRKHTRVNSADSIRLTASVSAQKNSIQGASEACEGSEMGCVLLIQVGLGQGPARSGAKSNFFEVLPAPVFLAKSRRA